MSEDRTLPSPLFDAEVNRAIQEALPEVVLDSLSLVTHLGDGVTLVALAVLLYWFGEEEDRHKRAMILAIAVATLALVAGLKGIFEVTRPVMIADPPLPYGPQDYGGFATPSAHAMGAAAIYGSLAVVMKSGERWQRYLIAGTIIVLVCFSRVAIGVHYVGDVITGALLGVGLVYIGVRLSRDSITPVFLLSLLIAVGGYLLGSGEFTTMAIGASLGGLVVWWNVEDLSARPHAGSIILLGILIFPLLLFLRALQWLVSIEGHIELAGTYTIGFLSIIETTGYAVAFGGAILVPFLAVTLNDTPAARRIYVLSPFTGRTLDPDAAGERITVTEQEEF